ncbi:MAG: hypothetical protein JNL79_10005 [Myxococcales bacterium]|nr:hypothetical protein [Myxococcales bacterium]
MSSRWERLRRRLVRLLELELRRPAAALLLGASLVGCLGPASTPRGKLEDAVQETNIAVRFGRTDIALEHVAMADRDGFLKRHRLWGVELRIVDLEFAGIEKIEPKQATLFVTFAWYRPNEGTMRQTKVKQTWKSEGGPWFLTDEERADGDVGLLGEPAVVVLKPTQQKPTHFETTVIK